MASAITLAQVEQNLPKHLKSYATQSLVDKLNRVSNDKYAAEAIKENFISYTGVLNNKRFSVDEYLNAVKYASYVMMGYTHRDAYIKTFPDRYAEHLKKGTPEKQIDSYVSSYNQGKLVSMILEQAIIPIHILNQDKVQSAVNTLANIMQDVKAPAIARVKAAETLLTQLKKPEKLETELRISVDMTDEVAELRSQTLKIAEMQQEAIRNGRSAADFAKMKVIGTSG